MIKKPKGEDSTSSPYNVLDILQDLEKVVKVQTITIGSENRTSTGLLCVDLMLGGGVTAGMYTFSGPEQSAKTTLAISILAASVPQAVGARVLWDAENSTGSSMDYVENVFSTQGVSVDSETMFGVKTKGKYTKTPLIYYRDEAEIDTFFNWFSGLLRRLPDKRFENDQWWYVYEANSENKAKYKGVANRNLSAANGAIYIPAKDGALQAVVLLDSWPALLPASLDEDDPKSGMALQAREFSKHLPRIKGKLRAKRVSLIGINQLRTAPAVMFKDPHYEPGGDALKFYSDVRFRITPRALSGVPFNPKGKGQYETEPSLSGDGSDTYRYVHAKAIKNKLSLPNRETWLRIWVQDEDQVARGFCPVWDTFYCLVLTGQVSGKRSSMLLDIHGLGQAKKNISWDEFKTLVLGDSEDVEAVCKKLGYRKMNLRRGLFSLMRKGVLEQLYSQTHRDKLKKAREKEDEDEDDDD